MSDITAVLSLQGRARRNARTASRALQLRRSQMLESETALAAAPLRVAAKAAPRSPRG